MFLAQAAPAGTENFLAIVFYLVGGIAAVVGLWKMTRKPEPGETSIAGQPVRVEPTVQYATKESHDNLDKKVDSLRIDMQEGFTALREDRSRSVGNLHERIEKMDLRSQQANADLRKEVKNDMAGLHARQDELLKAFSEMRGMVMNALKQSQHPFNG